MMGKYQCLKFSHIAVAMYSHSICGAPSLLCIIVNANPRIKQMGRSRNELPRGKKTFANPLLLLEQSTLPFQLLLH